MSGSAQEAEITEQDSLLLVKNLVRVAIYEVCYIRGLFPEKYFGDELVPALANMKIKKLMPVDQISLSLINWVEKGVYDALQKKCLMKVFFQICEATNSLLMEEYEFSFSYSCSDSHEVSMNINHMGNNKQGRFKSNANADITPNQMKSSACQMIRTLAQLMHTLDPMPKKHTIGMKIIFDKDKAPKDYMPPFFQLTQEGHKPWMKNPLEMEVGNVNSKHIELTLKVKSVLDPCQDESSGSTDYEDVSLGFSSIQMNDSSDYSSDSVN